jgi:hypothetical protein
MLTGIWLFLYRKHRGIKIGTKLVMHLVSSIVIIFLSYNPFTPDSFRALKIKNNEKLYHKGEKKLWKNY